MSANVAPPVDCTACDPVAQEDTVYQSPLERTIADVKLRLSYSLTKPNSSFVTTIDSHTDSVFKTKSHRQVGGEELTLITRCGEEFLASQCRPALPSELLTHKRLPDEKSPGVARLLVKAILRNPQQYMYLKTYMGEESLNHLVSNVNPVLVFFTLQKTLHDITYNLNHDHLMREIGFAKEQDNVKYSDNNIFHPLSFAYAITRMLTCEGHSGASHYLTSSRILTVLKAVALDEDAIVTWSMFGDKERELGLACENSLFPQECAPVSITRQVPSISGDKMGLFIELVKCALHLENLTPLTFEKREWFNPMNDMWQNIRNSKVFKRGNDGVPYYTGISMCDDTTDYRGFFSSSQCHVFLERPPTTTNLPVTHVYLKYPMPVEVGTVPDGDLTQYAHIPKRVELIEGETIVRRWNGEEYLYKGVSGDGSYILQSISRPTLLVTEGEFLSTGVINNMVYPNYLALPPQTPITYEDE